jgi:hypothetical protein
VVSRPWLWSGTREEAQEHTERQLERLLASCGRSEAQQEATRATVRAVIEAMPEHVVIRFAACEIDGEVVADPLRALGLAAATLGRDGQVAQETTALGWLSTVFLGSMIASGTGEPQFYETVLFSGDAERGSQLLDWRWPTRVAASAGHRAIAERIGAGATLEDLAAGARGVLR